jgi:hypothetical protein
MEIPKVATEPLVGYRRTRRAGAFVSRHALLRSWVPALAVGAALVMGLAAEHASPPSAARRPAPQNDLSTLPLAAQGVVSAAIGASSPAYRVSARGSGFQAQSPAQHLYARFGSAGVQIGSGRLQLGLSLRGVGYGRSLQPVGVVGPSAKANRVTYVRPGLREWYGNGPLGLEQGFTVLRAPSDRPAGPLTLSLALSGDAEATLAAGRRSLTLSRAGGPSLRYGDLLATDARGRSLHSWLELRTGRVLLRVDTRGARYPLRIDPLIQQGAKLTGKEEVEGAFFGESAALSSDGNTALIGGEGDSDSDGAAWVFTRTGSAWTQQGPKLVAPDTPTPSEFGQSVALSSDGDVALIGGPREGDGVGAAWVFTRSDSTWTLGPELTGGKDESGEAFFGASVALSSDGDTALVGGYDDAAASGAAWVFVRSGSTWVHQGSKLTSGEGGETFFGGSVALSSDGDTALIGSGGGGRNGTAWVFARSGSTWAQQGAKLTASGMNEGDISGSRVALAAAGTTALVGAAGLPFSGAVGGAWVFTRSGSTWTQQGSELTSGDSGETAFGSSVALSSDGGTALIGSGRDNSGRGAAWVFTRAGSIWTRQDPKLVGGEEENGSAMFGDSVALSSDASTALIGGPGDAEELGAQGSLGAAWVFVNAPPSVTTGGASGLGTSTATLNGEVDPNGLASTASFQYGTTAAYGQSTAGQSAGSAASAGPIAANVTGLAPRTTYHFRVLAESAGGTSYGVDQTFTTAPVIPASPVPVAPVNTAAPTISGAPIRGLALSVSQGSWSNGPTSFAYQWQRCDANGNSCATLSGAAGATHTLAQGDVGRRLRAIVTAGNAGGSSSTTSTASPIVGSQVEAAMTWTFGWSRSYTIVESLVVHEIPAGGTVEVTCHGGGCPFDRSHAAHAASHARCHGRGCKTKRSKPSQTEVNLTRLFRNRHLGVGTHIAVRILRAGWVGKSYLFVTRANQRPQIQIACLAPGSDRPGRGC